MALCSVASAFTPVLSSAEIEAAVRRGQQDARDTSQGLRHAHYVLFEVPDSLSINTDDQGEVDAVIVGTPRQMLEYRSYLASIQGSALSHTEAVQIGRELANTLHFTVFAHAPSDSSKDRDFLERFGGFQLAIRQGGPLAPTSRSNPRPAKDFYSLKGKGRMLRWLGTITVAFSLVQLKNAGVEISALTGTLSFTDSSGRVYELPVDLKRYD